MTVLKNRLKGSMAYLAGPMDDVADRGEGWRKEIKPFLWDLGIGVLCPFDKPNIDSVDEDENLFIKLADLKKKEEWEEAHEIARSIAADDYRMVDKADFILLYVNKDCHMCGSYHENCIATLQRKPVIVMVEQGKEYVPNWILSVGKHPMFFGSWKEVRAYIRHIAYAPKIDTHNRWRFFDYNKIFGIKNI